MNLPLLAFFGDISIAHWLVIVVGSVFLLLQIYCWLRFTLRLRSWRSLLLQLTKQKSGRASDFAKESPWLAWIAERFPEGQAPAGTYSRDEVMNELDDYIAADRSYLLLQRLSVMAPLLGVLLTVLGAMTLELRPEDLRQLDVMFSRVVPVIAGVGVGALLAFVNQWLLHAAGRSAASLRITARRWFDAYIWDALGSYTKSTAEQALESVANVADTILASAEKQTTGAKLIEEAAIAISAAGGNLKASGEQLHEQLDGLPQELGALREATESAVAGLAGFSATGERVLSQLDVSVAAFRGAVVDEFCESAKKQNEMLDRMNQSSEVLSLASRVLGGECRAFSTSVHQHADSMSEVNNTLKDVVIPAHNQFGERVGEFNGWAEEMFDRMGALYQEVADGMDQLKSLLPQAALGLESMKSSADEFRTAIQTEFTPAAQEHRESVQSLADSASVMKSSVEDIRQGSDQVAKTASVHADVSRKLKKSIENDVAPAHQHLHEALAAINPSAKQFGEQVCALGKMIQDAQAQIQDVGPQLSQAFAELSSATTSFRSSVESDFATAAQEHRTVAGQVSAGTELLATLINEQKELSQQGKPAYDQLAKAMTKIADTSDALRSSVVTEIGASVEELGTATKGFKGSAEQLSKFVKRGVDPATVRLAALEKSLAKFEATAKSLAKFSQAAGQVDQLTKSLSKAAEITGAIENLPESLREIIEEVCRRQIAENRSKGWFRRS